MDYRRPVIQTVGLGGRISAGRTEKNSQSSPDLPLPSPSQSNPMDGRVRLLPKYAVDWPRKVWMTIAILGVYFKGDTLGRPWSG